MNLILLPVLLAVALAAFNGGRIAEHWIEARQAELEEQP